MLMFLKLNKKKKLMLLSFVLVLIVCYKIINAVFFRFEVSGFEDILNENKVIFKSLNIDKIILRESQFSGNRAAMDTFIYRYNHANHYHLTFAYRLDGLEATFKNDTWTVTAPTAIKQYEKDGMKENFNKEMSKYLSFLKPKYENQLEWK